MRTRNSVLFLTGLIMAKVVFPLDQVACKSMGYENRNQVDIGPLIVSKVVGTVKDFQGWPVPKACIGVFDETGKRLVAVTRTNGRGQFGIGGLREGDYRLVIKYPGLCPANAKLKVSRQGSVRRSVKVRLIVGGLDVCSAVDLE